VAETRQLRPVAVDHLQGKGAVGGAGGPVGRPGERIPPVVENGGGQINRIKLVAMAEITHQGEDLLICGMADATAQAEEQTRLIQLACLTPANPSRSCIAAALAQKREPMAIARARRGAATTVRICW
jgi:hypothetical protein